MATNENVNLAPKVIRDLARELKNLDDSPPEDIKVHVNEENFSNVTADIEGPLGTPYEGGVFRMKLILSNDFPQTPPKGYFVTRIFHPNIAKNGEICVNTLKKDWKPTLGLRHVLLVVRCLLIEPFPESALNEEAGKMLMEDYEGYAKHARLMTSIHAMKPKPKSKVPIAESTSVNAGANDDAHTPLMHNTANKDNTLDSGVSVGISDAITATSPSAKKPKGELTSTKSLLDKKKMDVRKKSLKRL
jgi:ubiquitin-conjugating enzyme E2 S